MIKRYQYFNPSELPTRLASLMSSSRRTSPHPPLSHALRPDVVIVPSMDYANWLTVQLAGLNEQRITANISFYQPEGFIQEFNKELPDMEESKQWSKTALQFALYNYLPQWLNTGRVEGYGGFEEFDKLDHFKQFRMAGHLADAFDLYLVFRPDWLQSWRSTPLKKGDPHKQWQSQIWHLLTQAFPDINDRSQAWYVDRQTWLEQCSNWPENIYGIALATMPKSTVEWFGRFQQAEHTTLHLLEWKSYANIPVQANLFAERGNGNGKLPEQSGQLAETRQFWNRQRADFCQMCDSLWQATIAADDLPDTTMKTTSTRTGDKSCTLHHLQYGYKHPDPDQAQALSTCQPDDSLQVHMAHNPAREVELLHECLLNYFENIPDLRPDDILVATPDIETYGPILQSVFENPDDDSLAIPIHLNDPSRQPQNRLTKLLIRILETATGRFRVTEILDVISHPNIRRTFNLELDDVEIIEHWLLDLHTRWGYDKSHKEQVLQTHQPKKQEPTLKFSEQNSWMQALDRLWMGFSTRFSNKQYPLEILPYDAVEGSRHQRLLGTLHMIIHKLKKLDTFLKQDHDIETWLMKLQKIVREWITVDDDYKAYKNRLMEQIDTLSDDLEPVVDRSFNCSLDVILDTLDRYLLRDRLGVVRIGGRAVISSMVPTRSIPYKIIALVGLNEDTFPGKEGSNPFDLLQTDPLPGDRSRQTEDRQLFFDYIMAAEQKLMITCTGMNERTDEEIPPSAMVSELLSLLENYTGHKQEKWTEKHPLHSFRENKRTFLEHKARLASSAKQGKKEEMLFDTLADMEAPIPWEEWLEEESGPETITISLENVIRFYSHPIKFYLRNKLGLRLNEHAYADNDIEPFQLDPLDKYKAYNDILLTWLSDPTYRPNKQDLEQKGVLPHGRPGQKLWLETVHTLERQRQQILKHKGTDRLTDPITVEVQFTIEGNSLHLSGKSALLFNGHQLIVKTGGSSKAKDLLKARLKHSLLTAAGELVTTELWAGSKTMKLDVMMQPTDVGQDLKPSLQKEALSELKTLIKGYLIGARHPLAFLPKSTYEYATHYFSEDEIPPVELLHKALLSYYDPNSYKAYSNENNDRWYQYAFGNLNPYDGEEMAKKIIKTAKKIWEPIIAAKRNTL